ncbi:MAG TPA: hypothetical protein VM050_01360 [Patescibacteria group bacterium]|nr:hypothetical protein [Patescibacteria group bacterium]
MPKKVSCLSCTFIRKDIEEDDPVYRCQAHALREMDISQQLPCSRYRKGYGRVGILQEKLGAVKDQLETVFSTEPLMKLMQGDVKEG